MNKNTMESKYLQYLPSIYQGRKEDPSPDLLGRFLLAFESILSGIDGNDVVGIEKKLDTIHHYFDPFTIDEEYLQWLAGWVALILREGEGWSKEKKKKLISQIVGLYKMRGTRKGLEEYIRIYVGEDEDISIHEFISPIRVGITSHIGKDTVVGDGPPHYFQIHLKLTAPDQEQLYKTRQAIRDIIYLEKPAHVHYDLKITVPTMQINKYSTIGEDTLLGGIISE